MTQNEVTVPILTYHSLDSSGSVISTPPAKFREQMNQLAKSSLRVVTLPEIAKCIREKRELPANSVVLTFDDGFQSVHDVALPILREYGFSATVFLVTEFCGKNNRWYGQSGRIPCFDLLTWDQISVMAAHKVEFGVHTATHPDLTKLSPERIDAEINGAKRTLQDRLGTTEHAFAYPYGKSCFAADTLVKASFYAACSTVLEFASPRSGVHFLPRIDMYYFSNNEMFSKIGTPPFNRYIHFRKALRGVRSALART